MKRKLLLGGAVVAALVLVLAATAAGSRNVYHSGNLILFDNGGISPTKLPKRGSAPVTARIEGEIKTADGSHPPAIQHIEAEIGKTITVDATGLPACSRGKIEATNTATAKRACPDAIIGSGSAEVEVAFPEQAPFSATGPVVLFNGGVHGKKTVVYLHAYVSVPAPTAIIVPAELTPIHDGLYGTRLVATVPRIAGGAGSPTKFSLQIGRRFTYKGKKESYVSASCPGGTYRTKGEVEFSDGTKIAVNHVFPCTPSG
jgi:hypothetical protein